MPHSLKSYFVSDLHLFAKRSTASVIAPMLCEAASKSHTLVLGGDIFDFKWSTRPTLDNSIETAICWLDELIGSFPNCSFYYLLGNHDAHPKFVAELERLATLQSRLHWHPYALRILECVFLHGDIVDCEPSNEKLSESRKLHAAKPHPRKYKHWLYEFVVHARLHRAAIHLAVRQKSVLRKLSQYLVNEGLDHKSGVRDVYFGHTHRQVNGVQCDGLTYHNGGASIRGLPFRIIETRLPVKECN